MAGLGDMMARAQAAEGMMRDAGGAGPEGLPPEEEAAAPPMDLEGALSGVEAALEEMNPSDAEEARTHINAIREIAARAEPAAEEEAMPPAAEPEAVSPAGPDMGAMV